MKHRYILISRWHLACGIDDAWPRIAMLCGWPRWWPTVAGVTLEGDACDTPRVGRCARVEWKSRLSYGLKLNVTTTHVLPPFELEGTVEGDLVGRGLWLLESHGETHERGVMVTYRWDVRLNRAWMRAFAPLLRPIFAWNHFDVMRAGAKGLARDIGCRLIKMQEFSFVPNARAADKAALNPSTKVRSYSL